MTAQVPENDLELWSLTEAMCDGTITVAQRDRLQVLLETGRSAMRFYLAYLDQHAFMLWETRGTAETMPTLEEPNALEEVSRRPVLGFLGGTVRWTHEYFSQPGPLSILAATIFMVCMISLLSILPAPTYERSRFNHACTTSVSSPGRKPRDKDGKLNFVARITGLHDCKWSAEGRAPYGFDHLGIGRELKLDSGLVKITYYNGAKVVLEGPVEFTVEEANACRLDLGKLSAKVSKKAVGFTVETPGMSIVDLGTEFGVEVEQGGTADVHVFVGQIEAQLVGKAGVAGKKFRLTKGQAVRVVAGTGAITRLSGDAARSVSFARSIYGRPRLVAHYTFDGPSVVEDSGSGGRVSDTLTLHGGAAVVADSGDDRKGPSKILQLTGDDDFADAAGNSFDLRRPGSFTIALWAKFKVPISGQEMWAALLTKRTHAGVSTNNYFFGMGGEQEECDFIRLGFSVDGINTPLLDHPWDGDVGRWHHYAAVFDEPDCTTSLFIDGVEAASVAGFTGRPVTNDGNLMIGARETSGNPDFNGWIDDVRIYDAPLSAAQITGLFESGASGGNPQ